MKEKTPITVALYGFVKEHEAIMQSAFAHADQWPTPWILINAIEDARVIFVDLASEDDYGDVENLKRDFPRTEIVALSSKKPPQVIWHLVRQPNGKVSIVGFSQLVLKISHSLNRKLTEISQPDEAAIAEVVQPNAIMPTEPASISGEEVFDHEPSDVLDFFNTLDSLLDSKPHEKRKRFNES